MPSTSGGCSVATVLHWGFLRAFISWKLLFLPIKDRQDIIEKFLSAWVSQMPRSLDPLVNLLKPLIRFRVIVKWWLRHPTAAEPSRMWLSCQINRWSFRETKNSVNQFRLSKTVHLLSFNQPRINWRSKKKIQSRIYRQRLPWFKKKKCK